MGLRRELDVEGVQFHPGPSPSTDMPCSKTFLSGSRTGRHALNRLTMDIKQALQTLVDGQSLTREEMHRVMTEVMTGAATPTQIGALLVALRIRGKPSRKLSEPLRSCAAW